MLEFKSKKLDLKFNDKVYQLSYPTVKQLKKFSAKEKSDSFEAVFEMFVDCGLPEKVCEQLEADMVEAIIKELTASKK